MLKFQAEFYEEGNHNPVGEFLANLPKKAKIKASWLISLLSEKGNQMPSSYCKKLTPSNLWELKIDYGTNAYRIFFFYNDRTIILLHGISKKTNDTPTTDLNLSEKRMKTWLEGRGIKK